MCPLVLENSRTFGFNSHASTSAARALFVCRSRCPSVCSSRIMIIRSPTNTCMLLKTKSVLSSKYCRNMLNRSQKIAIFSGYHCLCFWAVMSALYIQHTSIIALVSLGYKNASCELVLLLESSLVIRIHVKLVAQSQQQRTMSTLAVNSRLQFHCAVLW